ncbi:MAG: hypothetical protein U0804_05090 [Gemmataceae bacterium]
MRRRAIGLAGAIVLACTDPAAAQTARGTTAPIPTSNRTLTPAPATSGLHLSAPIPRAGGSSAGFGGKHTAVGGPGAPHTTGSTAGTGVYAGGTAAGSGVLAAPGFGGSVLPGGATVPGFGGSVLTAGATGPGVLGTTGSAVASGNQIALLAEARLLVLQLEASGQLSLDRRESMFLTLLVYEALRQNATQTGTGTTTRNAFMTGPIINPATGTTYP